MFATVSRGCLNHRGVTPSVQLSALSSEQLVQSLKEMLCCNKELAIKFCIASEICVLCRFPPHSAIGDPSCHQPEPKPPPSRLWNFWW
jgi:hypothetical protein